MKPTLSRCEALFDQVPTELHTRSGKVFYSGSAAFSAPNDLYILGLNPGGDPDAQAEETVLSHTRAVLHTLPECWSAYRDESWGGAVPGTWKMQPRVLHMFQSLRLNPDSVPCSNLVFARSKDEASLKKELPQLVPACWPFHQGVIEYLRPKVVLCFGQTTGDEVCRRLGAHQLISTFVESNARRWKSSTYKAPSGLRVVVATHPSRVKWQEPATDPTPLLVSALHDA